MDLFAADDAPANLLPRDGVAVYHGPVFPREEAERIFKALLQGIPWASDEVVIFGKRIITARKVAWYGDPGLSYRYSGSTKQPLPWTPELLMLKATVERLAGTAFNSCLLNLYHHGQEGMGWHSDDEKSLAAEAPIASLSFGAERKFSFKHKHTGEGVSLLLETGSLLLMKAPTQAHWLHSLPKTKKVTALRVNLTFRVIARPG